MIDFPVNIHGEPRPAARETAISNGAWMIPEEVPIAFVFNRRNYAVMMGTPDDLLDFTLGFSLTEGVVTSLSDIRSVDIKQTPKGIDIRFKITDQALEQLDITQRRRNMVGSASCGLCGLENADTLFKVLPRVSDIKQALDTNILSRAISGLGKLQPLNKLTHSVHAAAWADLQGNIVHIREDVGRHNALDKLLGALVQAETDMTSGFVLMSSRCSYEIVEKAAKCGVQSIVSLSGPTAFAIQKAAEANISIYAQSKDGPIEVLGFSEKDRL